MLHGRVAERARLDEVVAGAAASRGGALVVRGEPGAGKTALLADLADRARDVTVLWTAGIESESPLAFAALHRLLRPVLGALDAVPPVQARALRRALGEREDGGRDDRTSGDDRFLVFAATLSVLAEAAEQQPLVCIVDDAHWLDTASAEALSFVARRVGADRIALVFAVRDDQARRFDGVGLPELPVPGLNASAADALLAEHTGGPLSPAVREELRKRTAGNPLALVELPRILSAEQLSGRVRLPSRLPLTQGVERAFLDRCRRLSEDAQTLLLVAAADDSGRFSVVQQAAARLGASDDALDEAERSGLVGVTATDVRLRHPLVRSALYGAATTSQRQSAHRALAAVLVRAGDPDRGSWHAALATSGVDDVVADGLDAVAERADHRGGHEAASAAAERAAELSSSSPARARRLFGAARSAWLAGEGARARGLADDARQLVSEPLLQADVDALRGRIEWHIGAPETGRRVILRAAAEVAAIDPARALTMRMQATALATWGAAVSPDEQGLDFSPPSLPADAPARLRCFAALLRGHQAFLRRDARAAASAWRQAFAAAETLPPEADLLVNLGIAAMHLGDVAVVQRSYGALLVLARDSGSVTTAVQALSRLPSGRVPTGEWQAAGAAANEALVLARGTGQVPLTTMPLAWVGLLAALRGDASATHALDELEAILAAQPVGIVGVAAADMAAWARGMLAATASDVQGALHHLGRIRHPTIARTAAFDRLEAAARAGRPDLVHAWADELEAFATAVGVAWPSAAAEHGRALISSGEAAELHFEQALRLHARSARPASQARTQLAYGEFLRRRRRRIDARTHLTAALQVFADLRAEPWAERARQELRASGGTARKRDATTESDLTPQERQTALLVSEGLANRDIAARLFLSPRTVEYHLSNVYSKLGVRSRGELAQLQLS